MTERVSDREPDVRVPPFADDPKSYRILPEPERMALAVRELRGISTGQRAFAIVLTEYQVANLRELLRAIELSPPDHPLRALYNGDWNGEIPWRLPLVGLPPNATAEQMIERAVGEADRG